MNGEMYGNDFEPRTFSDFGLHPKKCHAAFGIITATGNDFSEMQFKEMISNETANLF